MMEELVTKERLIPEVVGRYPATRRVFDRYGLKGCGGPQGPRESVAFFARAHGVEEAQLLSELNQTARKEAATPSSPVVYEETLADVLYRRFFKAGVVVILTGGALLGAVILSFIARDRSFTSLALLPWIHAHANAQVFGWVGLFVMGFAYQAFPRFKHGTLWRPELANLSFYLMGAGIGLRVLIVPLFPSGLYLGLGLLATFLELAAVALFVTVIVRTLRLSGRQDVYDRYLYAALFWFLVAAILNPILFYLVAGAPDVDTLVSRVATFFGPYRDIQLWGFAAFMIFGVSQRLLPAVLGLRQPDQAVSRALFWVLNLTLAAEVGFTWLFLRSHHIGPALGLQATYLIFLGAVLVLTAQLGLFSQRGEKDRSLKFVRAAYLWLAFATLMLALFPLYNRLTGQTFSHAFLGAYRHALTVGFISMMILGVSSKVVPTLSGVDPSRLGSLGRPFVLLNLGNSLRISFQILTDHFAGWPFAVMGVSGFIEVTALALWGYDLWKWIDARPVPRAEPAPARPERIEASMKVAEVVELFPETLEVFVQYGFTELQNPLKRRTLARVVRLEQACQMHAVDVSTFVEALNQRLQNGKGREPMSPTTDYVTLDVRGRPPFERHGKIFSTLDSLAAGQTLRLINDHDPKPLYYQLSAERAGEFAWAYRVQGPVDWEVEIKKLEATEGAALREKVARSLATIRPYLQADGGDVELVEVTDEGVVSVRLTGACQGCPRARATLQMGIERTLTEQVPEVKGVKEV